MFGAVDYAMPQPDSHPWSLVFLASLFDNERLYDSCRVGIVDIITERRR